MFTAQRDLLAGKTGFPSLDVIHQLLHEPEMRAIFADAVVRPRMQIVESILQAAMEDGDLDPKVVTPLTAPAMEIPGIEEDYLANTPLGRSGTPEEIAEAAVYLARAAWVTGEVLDINGGAHLMRYPDLVGHVTRAFG